MCRRPSSRHPIIPSGPMAVDDLANRIASFVSVGENDSVPVNGSWWNCRLSCLLDLSPVRRIDGGVNWWMKLLAIIFGSRLNLSANRTPLLGELCGCLPLWPITIRHRCDIPVRWSHLTMADCHLTSLFHTTSSSICLLRSLSASSAGFSSRYRSRSSASDMADADRVGLKCRMRSKWRGHLLYPLLSWWSSRLVRQLLFRQFQQGICRRLQRNVSSPHSWSLCRFAEAHLSWTERSWWWWWWANVRLPLRYRLTSLMVVRCHRRPGWCRAKLTGHLSVAA